MPSEYIQEQFFKTLNYIFIFSLADYIEDYSVFFIFTDIKIICLITIFINFYNLYLLNLLIIIRYLLIGLYVYLCFLYNVIKYFTII